MKNESDVFVMNVLCLDVEIYTTPRAGLFNIITKKTNEREGAREFFYLRFS